MGAPAGGVHASSDWAHENAAGAPAMACSAGEPPSIGAQHRRVLECRALPDPQGAAALAQRAYEKAQESLQAKRAALEAPPVGRGAGSVAGPGELEAAQIQRGCQRWHGWQAPLLPT